MKKRGCIITKIIAVVTVLVGIVCVVLNKSEQNNLKDENKNICKKLSKNATFYERYIKRFFDIVISICGLIVALLVVAVVAVFIYLEDPGSVIFRQKRVGLNKSYFNIHKLRSMKQNTGDIPTHLLSKEEQENRILKVGRFIRKTSIDELVQCFDVLRGTMTIVGPRPALWNQYDLIEERDKYGANDVRPGITGWAQINGRDELEIPVKAKLDGEYVAALRKSSWSGFVMDCKCFFGTFVSVLFSKGVVEGGTGSVNENEIKRAYTVGKTNEELIGSIGFGETVEIDKEVIKKILITGAGSYIGEAFRNYARSNYGDNFEIDELDMISDTWRECDFSNYDIVYHVAGIAHSDVGNVSDEVKQKYYQVNTDLAIEVAKEAKKAGVKEFIFMSSMIVYGDSAPYGQQKLIDEYTVPEPANFYGDSKLQADVAVRDLADADFKVIVLRPPMIYGAGSKGNYRTLVKIAKKIPVFPDVENQRSMLFIDNLCELLCQVMLVKEIKKNTVVLIPQNIEWTKTSDMVQEIAKANGKKLVVTQLLKPMVVVASKMPGKIGELVDKAFGNSCYKKSISIYSGIVYQEVSLEESIMLK